MDPFALLSRFSETTRHDWDERRELATNYKGWIERGGFVPTVRHKSDSGTGRKFRVTELYARGVHTYYISPDSQSPLLASEYTPVLPKEGNETAHYRSE